MGKKLEIVNVRSLINESQKIRPGMFRLDFLDLKWVSPSSIIEKIEHDIVKGNHVNSTGDSEFNAGVCLSELINLLTPALVNQDLENHHLRMEIENTPVEITQELVRDLKRQGRTYEATEILKAYREVTKEQLLKSKKKKKSLIQSRYWTSAVKGSWRIHSGFKEKKSGGQRV